MRSARALMTLVVVLSVYHTHALWLTQSDNPLGHSLVLFDYRCDKNIKYLPDDRMFVGWLKTGIEQNHKPTRSLCCLDSKVDQKGTEDVYCSSKKKFQYDLSQPITENCYDMEETSEPVPAREVLTFDQYRYLSEGFFLGKKAVYTDDDKAFWGGIYSIARPGSDMAWQKFKRVERVYQQRSDTMNPVVNPRCSLNPSYDGYDRGKVMSWRNAFEGRAVGLRVSSKDKEGNKIDTERTFLADEEKFSGAGLLRIPESQTVFVHPTLMLKATRINIPDYRLRFMVMEKLRKYNEGLPYRYLTTLGFMKTYRDWQKKEGDDIWREKVWVAKERKEEKAATCRHFVHDVYAVAQNMIAEERERREDDGEAGIDEEVSAESLEEWTCDHELYGDGKVCHCMCGAWDPDCDPRPPADGGWPPQLEYSTAPEKTDCPHSSHRCGPAGCQASHWVPLDTLVEVQDGKRLVSGVVAGSRGGQENRRRANIGMV